MPFIAIDELGAVTVGELREASRSVYAELGVAAELGVVLEGGRPRAVLRPGDIPREAGDQEALADYVGWMEQLELTGELESAPAAEWVAFQPQLAIIVHHELPFVLQAPEPLHDVDAVDLLAASPEIAAHAPAFRLPGPKEPLPNPRLRCRCPLGHRVLVPPEECPRDGLKANC